jgi:hypothetical protein
MGVVVEISHEQARGCGYRKPAKDGVGVYLVGPGDGVPCGRLPFKLHACPVCGGGIKASRGWNWIEPRKLFVPFYPPDTMCGSDQLFDWPTGGVNPRAVRLFCQTCPLGGAIPEGKHGLIWVGEGFYKTPEDFMAESRRMGVSRKIQQIPKDFELGKTWVFLAHRLTPTGGIDDKGDPVREPAIFTLFKPTGIDLVVADENHVPEKVEKMVEKYGARVIRVVPTEPPAEPAVNGQTSVADMIDELN